MTPPSASSPPSWSLRPLTATLLLLMMTSLPVSAMEPETCFSRQHQNVIVNVRLALNRPATAMDTRVVRSERDCVLACCSEEVKPGAKCNMAVFNGNKHGGENNCFLFHCQTEQDCPLMKAQDGINTYDIYKGLIHPTVIRPVAMTTTTGQTSTTTTTPAPTTQPTTTTTTQSTTTSATTTTTTTTTPAPTTTPPTTTQTAATTTAPPPIIIIATMPPLTAEPTTSTTTTRATTLTSTTTTTTPASTTTTTPASTTTTTTPASTTTTTPASTTTTTTPASTTTTTRKPNKPARKQNKAIKKARPHPVSTATTTRPTQSSTTSLSVIVPANKEAAPRTTDKPQRSTETTTTTTTTTTTITSTTTTTPTTTTTTTTPPPPPPTTTTTTTTTPTTTTTTTPLPTTTTTTTTEPPTTRTTPAESLIIVPKDAVQSDHTLQNSSIGRGKAVAARGAVKSGLVAFMVLGLAVLTLALAVGGRKAMESFDRRHYTRLELNDLHYEV